MGTLGEYYDTRCRVSLNRENGNASDFSMAQRKPISIRPRALWNFCRPGDGWGTQVNTVPGSTAECRALHSGKVYFPLSSATGAKQEGNLHVMLKECPRDRRMRRCFV